MIKEGSDFFQNAKFCPILVIYDLPDDQHVQFCMNSKFDAILQHVLRSCERVAIDEPPFVTSFTRYPICVHEPPKLS